MPHRFSIKTYIDDGYYHIYNRGVEKRNIFEDDQDYRVFLNLIKYYLRKPDNITNVPHPLTQIPNFPFKRPRPLSNLGSEVDLIAYCLMPNHFHLMLKQLNKDSMTKLMRRIMTTYAIYFNKRYKRVGYLFQGRYKAVLITNESYLLHLSRYIHLNPVAIDGMTRTLLVNYPYSSYQYYLGRKKADWIKPGFILSFFEKNKMLPDLLHYPSYQEFVEKQKQNSIEILDGLTINI